MFFVFFAGFVKTGVGVVKRKERPLAETSYWWFESSQRVSGNQRVRLLVFDKLLLVFELK